MVVRPDARALALVLGLSAGFAGCDCGDGGSLLRVVPRIAIEPTSVDFGEVPLGATRRILLTVKNIGSGPLTVSSVDTAAPFSVEVIDTEIAAGATGQVDVAFTPEDEERQTGALLVMSNADDNPMLSVALSGVGVAGVVDVRPREIDLPATTVGSTRAAELEVSNIGIEMVGGRIVPERFTRPEHWRLTGLTNFSESGGYAVAPRDRLTLEIEYRPVLAGTDRGRLLFEVCGSRCGIQIDVRASATEAVVRVDPALVDFGAVGIGQPKSLVLTVHNDGDIGLTLSRVVTMGGEFTLNPPVSTPVAIEAGGQLAINMEFTPSSAGFFTGDLFIETTETTAARVLVRLRGQGEGPLFQVEPTVINFGVERSLDTFRRAFLLLNAGSSEVNVSSVRISGDPEFALSGLPGLPIRLGSGESVVAFVEYRPTAAGRSSAVVTIESDDVAMSSIQIAVEGAYAEQSCVLQVDPGRLNFGLVPNSFRRVKQTTVSNVGNSACTIMSGAFDPPIDPAFALVSNPWPLMLQPTQTQTIAFSYSPVSQRVSKAEYRVTTDDMAFPDRTIAMVGSSKTDTNIFTLPLSLDFGETRPGCNSGERVVTLFNAGTTFATVEQVTLTSTSPEFSFLALPQSPTLVAPGGAVPYRVQYQPREVGLDVGFIEFDVRELPFNLITPMTARSASRPRTRDTFTQVLRREVDVLFVVDNSCSMRDEQTQLAQNFSSFISTANIRNVDFRLGVTTTDTTRGRGHLVGPVLKRSTRGYEQDFVAQVNVGTRGSASERGLEAMSLALQLATAPNPGGSGTNFNRDLIRPTATLVVIIVSDEDDQSAATEVTYFNELRSWAPNGFTTAVVSGQANGCTSAMLGRAFRAAKYERFVALTGGISESICSANWATTLANIGSVAFGLRSRFLLSQQADPAVPIQVKVNSMVVPSTSYRFDTNANTIEFLPMFVPAETSSIEIEYTPQC